MCIRDRGGAGHTAVCMATPAHTGWPHDPRNAGHERGASRSVSYTHLDVYKRQGYVGFAVPFAFAIAALLERRIDAQWLRWTRPWTNAAWAFLTLGIAIGSWWAYYELGWGGWWFWDPVENASFMPWLAGAALLHSQAVTEKRGSFGGWTLLLAITAFSLSLLGTFLVRSGVLTSVHAFAADPGRGLFVLIFLGIVIGGSLVLYALRAPDTESNAKPVSYTHLPPRSASM